MADITAGSGSAGELLLNNKQQLSSLLQFMKVWLFEYFPGKDIMVTYNYDMSVHWQCEGYLAMLEKHSHVHSEDLPRLRALLKGEAEGPVEARIIGADGKASYSSISLISRDDSSPLGIGMIGAVRDVTRERTYEFSLREKAQRDPLTGLFNRAYGQNAIEEYLYSKSPYSSCGMIVLDVDLFKNINDSYGHAFGDKVLLAIAQLLSSMFSESGFVIRAGGDEFVVFERDISHVALINKVSAMLDGIRSLSFEGSDCAVTCSAGACFLPANTFGYSYQQLFADADWALYRAKRFGRNRYEFCDDLRRYMLTDDERQPDGDLPRRYLQNDIISTAFEIFEKTSGFDPAIKLLLKVAGVRLQLDRITLIRTDIHTQKVSRAYQWRASNVPEALPVNDSYTKEDFLTLFRSYDENGTVVLHSDNMGAYSEGAKNLLMQGGAKTVVYCAMYCEGSYYGAISYVTCDGQRHWSRAQRAQLGELTKIIAAHMAKSQIVNFVQDENLRVTGIDSLTGLLSFSRFREEIEHLLISEPSQNYVLVYTDFESFRYVNSYYSYQQGDWLLHKFADYIIKGLESDTGVYFSRVVADQFVLFAPCRPADDYVSIIDNVNREFIKEYAPQFPAVELHLRSGIYFVEKGCTSASAAIDAANFARRQVSANSAVSVCLYTSELKEQQALETVIISGMTSALQNHEFEVYLQPKFSLSDLSVVGAEALVRWRRPDGTLLSPDSFVPIYERTGRIVELDMYMFEAVAQFLAKNTALGRRQVPISINASVMHTLDPDTVRKYTDILKKYNVSSELTEIELTETATVDQHDAVEQLFKQFRANGFCTSLDDFGAGYSVMNSVLDIPVNTIKIDRMFLLSCEASEKGIYLLRQIISVLRGLGYNVLCEGIETQHQLEFLRAAGCAQGQGYIFSKPLPIAEYEKFVYGNEAN